MTNENNDSGRKKVRFDYNVIPVFGATTPQIQEELEKIVNAFDKMDPEAAATYGENCLAERNALVERMYSEQAAQRLAFLREPMDALVASVNVETLQELGENVSQVLGKGAQVVKRNKLLAAGSLAVAWAAPALSAIGLAGIAAKEGVRAYKKRGEPPSVEELEAQIRTNIAGFAPKIRNLELAKQRIPDVRREINQHGLLNVDGLMELSLHISAGREIVKQINEKDIPAAVNDALRQTELKDVATALTQRVTVLESGRYMAIEDVAILGTTTQALANAANSIDSILTSEATHFRGRLVTQGQALESYKLSEAANAFRKSVHEGTKATIEIAGRAHEAALAGRVDSPEQLQATLGNMIRIRQLTSDMVKAIPAAETAQRELRKQIEGELSTIVKNQAKLADVVQGKTPLIEGAAGLPSLTHDRIN